MNILDIVSGQNKQSFRLIYPTSTCEGSTVFWVLETHQWTKQTKAAALLEVTFWWGRQIINV